MLRSCWVCWFDIGSDMVNYFLEFVICIIVMLVDVNFYGDIFGGWLMGLMDMGVGLIVVCYLYGCLVIVVMDGMQFYLLVKVGDEVLVYGWFDKVGCSLMVIVVEVWWCLCYEEQEFKVIEVVFIFVVIDGVGKF